MYSDYLSINKNFQSSVNLELDLSNINKINEYIPTTDICDVLKKYVKTVLGIEKNYATTLIGPYGKGKSFLLLILSYIFGTRKNDESWIKLLNKIKLIDDELYKLINILNEKGIKLLPVIINSNYDNIVQSFQIALNDSLKREGLDEIVPYSVFDVCLSLLDKWGGENSVKEEVLTKCEKLHKISITKLKKGLKAYSPSAYKQFETLYNCVNIGLEFNPLVNNDIVKTYSDVSSIIANYGYNGLFIIFDEFSKFIENNTSHLMYDLKIIQDLAEVAARSGKQQLHICCVTHKSIALYELNKKAKNMVDSLKTVEGRFKEIKFNRSLDENYQIISSAIIKNDNAVEEIKKFIKDNDMLYSSFSNLSIFSEGTKKDVLFEGCFPLNPITTYSLIQISELVAQNERTLFTFLTDTDDNSFNSFIHRNNSGLFNVDKIYDYFSNLLQREETNSIRNVWYRTESLLSKIENAEARKIIKSLSIITMINDQDRFPASDILLSLSAGIELKLTTSIINDLIEKHYLRRNLLNNYISFALSNTKQIDEAIELYKQSKYKNADYGALLTAINDRKYILPRKYNEENKITRFYNVLFLSEDRFEEAKSFNYYFETNYCDGVIINLLKESLNKQQIIKKVNTIGDSRIFVRYPKERIDDVFYQSVIRFACLKDLKNQKGLDDITLNEIDLLLQETESDLKTLLEKYFNVESSFYTIDRDKNDSFNSQLSISMEKIYPIKLIFNNELINKKDVSTQYQKAINHVIDWLIDGVDEFPYSETSPEMSIKKSVIDKNDISISNTSSLNFRNIIDEIKEGITSSKGLKIDITSIVGKYSLPPFGIRKGVLPLIFAYAISELSSDNVVLYFQTREIELDSGNIVKAVDNEKYSISFSKGSLEQKTYLNKLLKLFDLSTSNNFRKDTYSVSNSIKRFFVGLPQIVRMNSLGDNYLNLDEPFIKYKSLFLSFNLNPFDALYIESKKIFRTNKFLDISKDIKSFVDNKEFIILPFKQKIIDSIKEIFGIAKISSLKSGFIDYFAKILNHDSRPILEEKHRAIYNLTTIELNYDDFECVDKLSKIIIGQHIEDWDSNNSEKLINEMIIFKRNLAEVQCINSTTNVIEEFSSNIELSGMASLLKNNVESVLEEFSGSVSSSEKVAVLSSLIKDLL